VGATAAGDRGGHGAGGGNGGGLAVRRWAAGGRWVGIEGR
jgi:hypothetical protein